ncbi:TetR/AcrR family transcriptional regulator [Pseudomonas sp. SMV7]|uniref:TetR/AcrR family transcriptional regulator n=1 Tax=Pseudomonas sp. SMV7 TaxID=3390194 RepID=UPI003F875570
MSGRGRPREFDRHQALVQAMLLFWDKGYDGTSLNELMTAMKIKSPSLYAAFGSKEDLFLEALELYWSTVGEEIWSELYKHERAQDSIQAVLLATARILTREDRPHGCFVTQTDLKSPLPNLRVGLKVLRCKPFEMLKNRLRLGQASREIGPHVDCDSVAHYYGIVQRGMAMVARDGSPRDTLEKVASHAMGTWDKIVPYPTAY